MMTLRIFRHFQLVIQLMVDKRVSLWPKILFIFLPLIMVLVPIGFEVPDFLPVFGLLDDLLFLFGCSLIFRQLVSDEIVADTLAKIQKDAPIERYRHPEEDYRLASGIIGMMVLFLVFGNTILVVWFTAILAVYFFRLIRLAILTKKSVEVDSNHYAELEERVQAVLANTQVKHLRIKVHERKYPQLGYGISMQSLTCLVSKRYLETKGADTVAKEYAILAAHAAFDHVGLLFAIDCDLTRISALMLNTWKKYSRASAEALASAKIEHTGNPDWDLTPSPEAI